MKAIHADRAHGTKQEARTHDRDLISNTLKRDTNQSGGFLRWCGRLAGVLLFLTLFGQKKTLPPGWPRFAFANKVRAQLGPSDGALADLLIDTAQNIIEKAARQLL